ncbi:MAG: hypothetical protein A2381_13895 [Bdellovibrionales bacterium RIFOXYB1_FULL_37_110]|nr:MAG: hypothetical protein A2417_05530 [Bdellovibrionales bacterium RIFOXYC1_FULL_37_79]OFZ56953.1 MAG: hypothetical protein A2381_13895 [Bdellovibrionales bacterium RIFOXYB1_FULL_37_110]OFZ62040.1 MAG: hypothetical protein A2577_19365 [Bdellovibrionales bacterium RIFOXYD1_FULL_36_51]
MIYLVLITLLSAFSTSSWATMFEKRIDVGLSNLSILSDEINLFGSTELTHLTFASAFANVTLRDQKLKKYAININPEMIQVVGGDFNYTFPSLANFDGINYKKILSHHFNFQLYNNILAIKSDYFEIETSTYYLKAIMFGLECFLDNNEIDIERCLNNSQITSYDQVISPSIHFNNTESDLEINANSITLTPDRLKVDANQLNYASNTLEVALKESNIECQKNWVTPNSQGIDFVRGCLTEGNLKKGWFEVFLPEQSIKATLFNNQMAINDYHFDFNLKSSQIEMKDQAVFSTEKTAFRCHAQTHLNALETFDFQKMLFECASELRSDIENLSYQSKDFLLKMDNFHYETKQEDLTKIHARINNISGSKDTSSFLIPTVSARCNNIKSFDLSALITDCLMDGTIELPTIDLNDPKTQTQVKINISSANIKNNQFILNAPQITITSPTIKASIHNIEASCKRNQDDPPLDFELLQRRCFENSLLKIPLIKATNNKYALQLEIKDVSVDKNQLFLNIPAANYKLNNNSIYFEKMSFLCNPNVTFENFQDLNVNNVLDNCVNNTKIKIKTVKNALNGASKRTKYENVDFVTANSNFILKLKMSVMLIPTEPKFEGKIMYNKTTSEIILTVMKASAGPLLKKNAILFLMKNFFADENIRVEGNKIIARLGEISTSP